jgi:hypothetical protein
MTNLNVVTPRNTPEYAQSSTTSNRSAIQQSSTVTTFPARSKENADTSNWVWSPLLLAVFRCGGSAVSFGGVTWHDHKAVESFASHWSGSGRRNSGRGRVAMVACLSGAGGRKNSDVQRGISPNSLSHS